MNNRTMVGAGMTGVGAIAFWSQVYNLLADQRNFNLAIFVASIIIGPTGLALLMTDPKRRKRQSRLGEFE